VLGRRRDQFEQEVFEMSFVHRYPELSSGLLTEFSTYFHLCRKSDNRDPDFVSDTGLEGFVDVTRVTSRKRTKDDEDLSRGVRREVAHGALGHLDRVLETGIASWLQFMSF